MGANPKGTPRSVPRPAVSSFRIRLGSPARRPRLLSTLDNGSPVIQHLCIWCRLRHCHYADAAGNFVEAGPLVPIQATFLPVTSLIRDIRALLSSIRTIAGRRNKEHSLRVKCQALQTFFRRRPSQRFFHRRIAVRVGPTLVYAPMPELRYRNRGSAGASVKHSLGSRPATSTRLLPSPRPPRTSPAAVSSVDRCFESRLGRRLGELRSEDALDYSATAYG